jgi:hypothetical protein
MYRSYCIPRGLGILVESGYGFTVMPYIKLNEQEIDSSDRHAVT